MIQSIWIAARKSSGVIRNASLLVLLSSSLLFGAIPVATGSGVGALPAPQGPFFDITAYGAVSGGSALTNQTAINNAINAAAAAGGGTVLIPAGDFKTYSIRLKSNVGIHFLSPSSIIRAAIQGTGANQDGGFYDAPEENLFVGLQDEGHSHWENSLIYGIGVQNVMISGPGLIDGSYFNASNVIVDVISTNDPGEVTTRTASGTAGGANKAIALKNATDVIFSGFSIKNGGHFGILGTGVVNWTLDGINIDTDRDAIDIDNSTNVTVRNSVFNSIQDDGLVLKASFALGTFTPTKNVLIENDTVSAYEPGSELTGAYAQGQLTPVTGRVKLGTEATGGFDTITIENVRFQHSAGFALESVDGAVLTNIIMTNCTMNDVTTPILIRLGDRGRTPVTGISTSEAVSPTNNVRVDNTDYILPDLTSMFGYYPATRYSPSYSQNTSVPVGGENNVGSIVNQATPTILNPNQPCSGCATNPSDADAIGPGADSGYANVSNISISNLTVTDADPRYPITLAGLVGYPIQNVSLSNISVQYRGGLTLLQAVENRALSTRWSYYKYQGSTTSLSSGNIAWFGGSSNEGNLPRIGWDPTAANGAGGWVNDPYNIPELPFLYPENVMFGPLPAYGIWARHVNGLTVDNVNLSFIVPDTRPAVVLDDVSNAQFQNFTAQVSAGVPAFVEVTNTMKRPADFEYVQNLPYQTTTNTSVSLPPGATVEDVTVSRPAPGTPPDTLYTYPTVPSAANPYSFAVANAGYPLPATVYRPFFGTTTPSATYSVLAGQPLQFKVQGYNPISGSEAVAQVGLTYSANNLPPGASFDPGGQVFNWTPNASQVGTYTVPFVVNDGIIPETKNVVITVTAGPPELTASISSKTGPSNARIWDIAINNVGLATAHAVAINGFALTQTFGAACTPSITGTSITGMSSNVSSVPLGDLSAGSTASVGITINFSGCAANARFSLAIPYSADAGAETGTIARTNQFQ